MLGGSLQLIALGWANIGAASTRWEPPASVAFKLFLVQSGGAKDDILSSYSHSYSSCSSGLLDHGLVRTASVLPKFMVLILSAKKEIFVVLKEAHYTAPPSSKGAMYCSPRYLLLILRISKKAALQSMPVWPQRRDAGRHG